MQDELSSEWGEGRVKQAESQKDAVNELRKLGTPISFASPQPKEGWDFDFKLFSIGHNPETRVSAAILYFERAQGIIFLHMPNQVYNFLKKYYDQDAKKHVWEKAKNGFFTETIKPDSESGNGKIHNADEIQDLASFNGDNFTLLRNLLRKFWISKFIVNEPYARILTSYYLWSEVLFYPNSKKKISPGQITIAKLPMKGISVDWSDEVGVNSLTQARHNYSSQFQGYEHKMTTHDQEDIGETYAHIVLQNEIEHLNPPPRTP